MPILSGKERHSRAEASLISIVLVILVMATSRNAKGAHSRQAATGAGRRRDARALWDRLRDWRKARLSPSRPDGLKSQ
ncbi:hypothetical protein C3920_10565 [Novacetimonas pomaceti]|uniref:Uncharacterized protein n=1 Tax=Novacetimonas pomaceti TaxID=2021998 RepID=A0A318Q8L5_9PROT|nr:hypothetical protein C3920_10565 [Novacetimonas pomaceti]PYD75956.1 hypothetical protein CFR71_06120 [Novacetimonas pomaceti]